MRYNGRHWNGWSDGNYPLHNQPSPPGIKSTFLVMRWLINRPLIRNTLVWKISTFSSSQVAVIVCISSYKNTHESCIFPNNLLFFWLIVWPHNFKESTPKVDQLLSQNMFCLVSSFDVDFVTSIYFFNMLSISIWSNFHLHS